MSQWRNVTITNYFGGGMSVRAKEWSQDSSLFSTAGKPKSCFRTPLWALMYTSVPSGFVLIYVGKGQAKSKFLPETYKPN